MFKKFLYTFVFFISTGLLFISFQGNRAPSFLLIQNMKNENTLPRNFRKCSDPFKIDSQIPSREGFSDLPISGSGQFSEKSLNAMMDHLGGNPDRLYIIDLREEHHGFLNGIAVSWYAPKNWMNYGKSKDQIENGENKALNQLQNKKTEILNEVVKKDKTGAKLPETEQKSISVQITSSEKKFVTATGAHYIRIPLTDHLKPSDERVDEFIALVKQIPKSAWLHFHCSAGMGRTTTLMTMYDMIKNAKNVSFQDIIRRHFYIGGTHLQKILEPTQWKYAYHAERILFLEAFYQYCRDNKDDFTTPWSYYTRGKL